MGVLGETTVTFMKRFSFRSVLSGKPFRTAETPPDEVILSGKSSKVAKKEPKTASKSLQGIKLNCFRSKAGRLANRTDFREEWLIGRTDPVPSLEKDGKTQSLSLTEVYKPYHDRGITGDTEKVMVFDSGLPRRNLELKKKAFFKFDGQAFQEDHSLSKRGDSHAEAVTHILSQALPDAEFIFYGTAHPPEDFEIFKKHGVSQIAYLKGRQKITYELYKELLYSRLQNYKKAIIHGVNQGATLINMSLGLDYMTARLKDYNREEQLAALKGDKILKP